MTEDNIGQSANNQTMKTDPSEQNLPLVTFIPSDPYTDVRLKVPIDIFIEFYTALDLIGMDAVVFIAEFGASFVQATELTPQVQLQIRIFFKGIKDLQINEQWVTPTDVLISCCYHMLCAQKMTREHAAHVASRILGEPISIDTWRLRVDRWAANRSLPKVALRKSRKA